MKNILILLMLATMVTSCKNTEEKDALENQAEDVASETAQTYRGEFIHTGDAAVLKGNNFIYGVVLDDTAKELAERVKPSKKDPFDMVKVVVTGTVSQNPAVAKGEEGWPEVITIKEILHVDKKPAPADIKIKETKE